MDDLIQALTDDLRLMRAGGLHWLQITPTVVVGPPSVGKTRFARRLAYLAGTGYTELSGAGMTDNRVLQGTSRGWSTAQPCLPLLTMMRTHTANPLIVFDELDKTGGSDRNGDTKETLLSMLERETAKAWPDPCLLAPADLSRVNWLFPANDIARLPTVLRSRLRIVHVAAPGPEHFEPILIGILADVAADLMLRPQDLPPLPATSLRSLRHAFAEGTPIRAIKRAVRRVLARAPAHRLHH